ncbi:MAG: cytochrome c3 family protein [Acidobacteriota bacterium]|jgi:cytochrome b subunit of formate dehydrogenase
MRGKIPGRFGAWLLLGAAGCLLCSLAATALPAAAQEEELCLECHADPEMFPGADEAHYLVDPEQYAGSVHGRMELLCSDCHLDRDDIPHEGPAAPVLCGDCHDSEAADHARSLHGQAAARGDPLAPTCADCHGTHDILGPDNPLSRVRVMNIPFLCGECHHEGTAVSRTREIPQDRILENYSLSIHGEGLYRQGLTVTAVCTSCHTSHLILPHTDPDSSINRDNVSGTCTQCHGNIEEVHRQVIEGVRWETEPGAIPACVDCHSPHRIRRVYYDTGAATENCMNCHADEELTGDTVTSGGEPVSLYIDETAHNAGVHAQIACAQCHTGVNTVLTRPCAAITDPVDCASCHEDQTNDYHSSVHGRLAAQGDPDAPVCLDCHEKHATQSQRTPTSRTFPRNVPELCGQCHRKGEQAAVRILHEGDFTPVESYEMSIHGKGLYESGLLVTATCSDCHSPHKTLPADDPDSTVNDANVHTTCGQCHDGIEQEFMQSVHSPTEGEISDISQLPTCEDCHSSHTISRVDRADFRLSMMDQCGRCHESESETFFDTFHGKVSRLGDAAAAKCYDCHGTHSIQPPGDPRSTLSRRNIVATCSQCHAGANVRFTGYLTHATHHDPEKYPFLFWAFWGMTTLLVGTLSFASVHTAAWLWRLARSPEARAAHQVKAGEKLYRRFTSFQRTLHISMMLSFFTLALTGMILKFSHMAWAQTAAWVVGGFQTTGVLHRIGAVVLLIVSVTHLADQRRRKRASGKTWWQYINSSDNLMFNWSDIGEFFASIKWFLGLGPRPYYGRYTYWEKFDYFAVFWGMVVIGSTGLLLWFPEFFTMVLPGQLINVATIIHSDEALLAVAFIFTIHFFNTHFRPDKFPMDPVMFTGRVPLDELKRDKPREYEELVASGDLEENLVNPYPKHLERFYKGFGFFALFVGLTLIVLIVYSMLFGYQ